MSQPKKKNALLALLPAVIVYSFTAYILIDSMISEQRDLAQFAKYEIVYRCRQDHSERSDICIINGDGTGERRITANNSISDLNSDPVMNQQGQILYLCNLHDKIDYERHHLCTIRADGSGSTDLTPSAKDITRGIDMNNAGQFVYECYPAICLGTINSDGSLAGEVQEIAQDGARYYAYPSLNDRGQMAFVCFDTAEGVDICAENLDQSNLVRLTKVTDGSISIYPVINDDGLIAYSCGSPDFSRVIDICVIRADGTAQRNLTDTQSLRYNRGQSMNNRGQMAFSCATPEERIRSNICAMNVDGSDWHQLTRHYGKTYYGSPSINGDGVIVYVCGVNLCIMNFDGSSQHQLTNFAGE